MPVLRMSKRQRRPSDTHTNNIIDPCHVVDERIITVELDNNPVHSFDERVLDKEVRNQIVKHIKDLETLTKQKLNSYKNKLINEKVNANHVIARCKKLELKLII